MSTRTPIARWPQATIFEGRTVVDGWEIEVMLAEVVGRPPPPEPLFVELLTPPEIAERVGISEGQVRKRLRQARKQADEASQAPDQSSRAA
jgi:hypothetical protein